MARLTHVRPGVDPGYRRIRAGRSFRYEDEKGKAAPNAAVRRIRELVIPPAWEDVWIAVDPHAHIQAVGVDDAGRRQYIYHPHWRLRQDRTKFTRALALAEALPRARARVTSTLHRGELGQDVTLAASFRLLDEAAPRVGSARYFNKHGSRGLTTLQRRDATVVESAVTLSFPAKSGQRAFLEIDDAELAAVIVHLIEGRARSPLLWYLRGRRQMGLTPSEVNAYVRTLTGGAFTAKDFRTLRGTILAAESLARIGTVDTESDRKRAEVLAVRATATALGNTPSVARGSYIDPRVFQRYARGELLDLSVSGETAIRRLLSDDPEG